MGVTLVCIYLLFLNPQEISQPLCASRSIRPIESNLRSHRTRVLAIVCVVLIVASVISLIYATPDVQSQSPCPFCFAEFGSNRMTGSMLHLRRSPFTNLVVSGQRNLTFDLIPQYFYSGPISKYVHLMLELNGSLTTYLAVRVNNRILWEYNSSYPMENMTTNIPVSWINGPDLVITITSPAWLLKWGVFRADLDVSHMPSYFEKFGAALYLPQALSLGVLLAYLVLQRRRKLRVQG